MMISKERCVLHQIQSGASVRGVGSMAGGRDECVRQSIGETTNGVEVVSKVALDIDKQVLSVCWRILLTFMMLTQYSVTSASFSGW